MTYLEPYLFSPGWWKMVINGENRRSGQISRSVKGLEYIHLSRINPTLITKNVKNKWDFMGKIGEMTKH